MAKVLTESASYDSVTVPEGTDSRNDAADVVEALAQALTNRTKYLRDAVDAHVATDFARRDTTNTFTAANTFTQTLTSNVNLVAGGDVIAGDDVIVTNDCTIGDDCHITDRLTVGGDAELAGTLKAASGAANPKLLGADVNGNLDVSGTSTLGGAVSIANDVTLSDNTKLIKYSTKPTRQKDFSLIGASFDYPDLGAWQFDLANGCWRLVSATGNQSLAVALPPLPTSAVIKKVSVRFQMFGTVSPVVYVGRVPSANWSLQNGNPGGITLYSQDNSPSSTGWQKVDVSINGSTGITITGDESWFLSVQCLTAGTSGVGDEVHRARVEFEDPGPRNH